MMIPGKELDSSSDIPIISSSSDIIRQLQPVVIPRITAISHMAVCERAAYNIEFLGMQSGDFTASGEIGSAVHRIVIKSTLEIINSIKKGSGSPISKSNAIDLFRNNAIDIAAEIRKDRTTVSRYLNELKDLDLITFNTHGRETVYKATLPTQILYELKRMPGIENGERREEIEKGEEGEEGEEERHV